MPYVTVVAGSVITASWGNANVRDQNVTPFATAAARASAITTPIAGMLSYRADLPGWEGYTAAAWHRLLDDSMGKGLIYALRRGDNVDITGAFTTVETTIVSKTVTLETGRTYRVTATAGIWANNSGNGFYLFLKDGSTVIDQTAEIWTPTVNNSTVGVIVAIYTAAGTAATFNLTAKRTTGTGSLHCTAYADTPVKLIVEDVGTTAISTS